MWQCNAILGAKDLTSFERFCSDAGIGIDHIEIPVGSLAVLRWTMQPLVLAGFEMFGITVVDARESFFTLTFAA